MSTIKRTEEMEIVSESPVKKTLKSRKLIENK